MSPMMDEMLMNEVVPRLKNVVRTIPKIGHEDDEEIVQDATLMAARMMDSAEKAGKTITGGNVSYYAMLPAVNLRPAFSAESIIRAACSVQSWTISSSSSWPTFGTVWTDFLRRGTTS